MADILTSHLPIATSGQVTDITRNHVILDSDESSRTVRISIQELARLLNVTLEPGNIDPGETVGRGDNEVTILDLSAALRTLVENSINNIEIDTISNLLTITKNNGTTFEVALPAGGGSGTGPAGASRSLRKENGDFIETEGGDFLEGEDG